MSYIKCYWGQFVILDLDYITYFSNYKYNNNNQNHSTHEFQIDKYNYMKNKLRQATCYERVNTLNMIYETKFEFDEEISNPNIIKEIDTSERVVAEGAFGFGSLHQIARPIIMILCMTAVSLYIIL